MATQPDSPDRSILPPPDPPFRGEINVAYGKGVASGGGCSTAAVVSWPARIKDHGGIRRQFHHHIDITPTILESAGVPAPTRVNGVDQMPMAGVSMLYTFDDAEARDRHTTQYFELTGTRAIYHDGWWAGTRHGQDGLTAAASTVPFDQDVWELYDMTTDFGHATDLAAEHPEKLAELQAIFDREARKYNVYPLADNILALLSAERPGLVSGNKASYRPGTVRIPEDAVINIKNRSFTLTAELENPDGNAEGILVTVGGETGGYALVVQNAKPTFHYNWLGRERYTITSTEPLPNGPCTIRFDFAYDGGGAGKGGTGRCRSTTRRLPKAASKRPSRSSSRPTTPSTSARTGARQSRRPTNRRSSSPAP